MPPGSGCSQNPKAPSRVARGELRRQSESACRLNSLSSQQQDADATELIENALKFKIKIWDTAKLDSVLSRCLDEPSAVVPAPSTTSKQRNPHTLSKLLQSERLHGSSERDPTQKRHDFRYFARGSHFLLIEDMYGELATIATHEYPALKKADDDKTPWPTLYCHPRARGPFVRFDEREKRRWERLQLAEKKEKEERQLRRETLLRKLPMEKEVNSRPLARKAGDLRRSVSLNNIANIDKFGFPLADHDVDGDAIESAHASGYLASGLMGYTAASGNSVNITSTTGTTSTSNCAARALQMPSNLSGRTRAEVVMRKQPQEKLNRTNPMGPPVDVPQRSMILKKSKSTNTLKLPKREEGSKPGYCESCRQKFDDFKEVSFLSS
jgi:regulatory subunit for Cdc7p protein kinase